MSICKICRRRRTTDWHICVPNRLNPPGQAGAEATASASRQATGAITAAPEGAQSNRSDSMRRINTIRLPGDSPVARIWNSLVEGKKP